MKTPHALQDGTLDLVAERFRLLGDPLRLRLLRMLAAGEHSVAALVAASGTTQANVSKHLQLLLRAGVVQRRRDGLHGYYSIADPTVFELCDLVCGSLSTRLRDQLAGLPAVGPQMPQRAPRGRPRRS